MGAFFYIPEDKLQNFKRAFNKFPLISFKFEKEGSKIIFNSKNQDD